MAVGPERFFGASQNRTPWSVSTVVDRVGHGRDPGAEEARSRADGRFLLQLCEGELGGAVNRDEEGGFAVLGPDLGEVEVDGADGGGGEALLRGLVALDLGPAAAARALKAAV
jgi:hypothetical protein